MHRRRHPAPAGKGRLAIEVGNGGAIHGQRMVDGGALGDDEADAARSALAVIFGDIGTGHAAGRKLARHWRHGDAVGDGEPPHLQGLE